METGTIIGFLTAAASVGGAVVSYIFAKRASQRQKQVQEIELAHWRHQYLGEIRTWGDQVVEAMAEAVLLCDLDPARCTEPTFFTRRHRMLVRLSGLIDRGRFFFPNDDVSADGRTYTIALRGFRDPILDPAVDAYEAVRSMNYDEQGPNVAVRLRLTEIKRDFTNRMQVVLDPNARRADFERFVSMTEELREEAGP